MSYIHEALKKAQDERDLGKGSYAGITAPHLRKPRIALRKSILWTILVLMVLLAFAVYSWWDLKNEKRDAGSWQNRKVIFSPSGVTRETLSAVMPKSKKSEQNHHSLVPESAAACYEKAKALNREGRLLDAGAWYEKVIAIDPGHVQALNNLGVLRLHKKDYPAARRCFEKASHLKPDYVDPYYNLACVFAVEGQVDQGLRYLEKAIALDSNVKEWARKDPDLDPLKESVLFRKMVGE